MEDIVCGGGIVIGLCGAENRDPRGRVLSSFLIAVGAGGNPRLMEEGWLSGPPAVVGAGLPKKPPGVADVGAEAGPGACWKPSVNGAGAPGVPGVPNGLRVAGEVPGGAVVGRTTGGVADPAGIGVVELGVACAPNKGTDKEG